MPGNVTEYLGEGIVLLCALHCVLGEHTNAFLKLPVEFAA